MIVQLVYGHMAGPFCFMYHVTVQWKLRVSVLSKIQVGAPLGGPARVSGWPPPALA